MPSEVLPEGWTTSTVEQLMLDGAVTYGVVQPGPAVDSGTPMLRVNNFRGYGLDTSDVMRIAKEVEAKYARTRIRADDVLITVVGSVGQVAVVPAELTGWNLARAVALLRPRERELARWIGSCLRAPTTQHALGMAANTTVQTTINLKDLRKLELPMPPAAERVAIQEVLSALDDRIDLLRQTNATLESIAQALFKSWFVDFDPVRAKAEGREPEGMDAATAALFPAAFEESALGVIPKGWTVSTLAGQVSAERGLSYKGAGLCDAGAGVPMHNLNSVLEGGGYKYAGLKHYSGEFKERHTVSGGDVIVANTEQGHEHRLIGFPAIVPMRYQRAIFSHHLYRVRLRPDSPLTVHTLYFLLMAPSVREQVIGCANGSTVNMLKVAGLEIPQFVCPSPDAANAFEAIAQPLRRQAEANVERITALTELRDTLLPRLISGKLRLPEAQAHLSEALA